MISVAEVHRRTSATLGESNRHLLTSRAGFVEGQVRLNLASEMIERHILEKAIVKQPIRESRPVSRYLYDPMRSIRLR
jgi:hypothetical protein